MIDFLRVCVSDLIRSCSQQDPRDLRTRKRQSPIDDAPVLTTLLLKARGEIEKLKIGQELISQYPWDTPNVSVDLYDTRTLVPSRHPVLKDRVVDAVVSSPPYATALPYVDTDRLSFIVLGLMSKRATKRLAREMIGSRELRERDRLCIEERMDQQNFRGLPNSLQTDLYEILETNRSYEVGFRKRNTPALLYRYFIGMRTALRNIAESMRVGGEAYLVVGDSKTVLGDGRTFSIRTCDHIGRIAERVGFVWEDSIPITVTTENLAHIRNAITMNEVLVLRKAVAD